MGNIPYSEAAGDNAAPKFDNQVEVYAALQTLLSSAITDLDGAGSGPGAFDLVYNGDKAKWKQAAYTLKARYYMHTAEADARYVRECGVPERDHGGEQRDRELGERLQGVPRVGDVGAEHLVPVPDGVGLRAGSRGRGAPRGPHEGAERSTSRRLLLPNEAGGYGGLDVNSATPANQISALNLDPEYRQPLLTWAENQLILAEAKFQTGGGAAAAAPHVNAVRQAVGLAPLAVGQVTLQSIMEEKYVALFQNVEAWSDYRRTCFPVLDPALSAAAIPGRVYYGQAEENANPNTPTVAAQDAANGGRNLTIHGLRPSVI